LKKASGCFQNVGKNVLTPKGSTLKIDVCFGNYGKKKSVPVIFKQPCIGVAKILLRYRESVACKYSGPSLYHRYDHAPT
jgi:hypothetical protein